MMGALLVFLLLFQQELLVDSKEIRTKEFGTWNHTTKLGKKGIDVAGMTTLTFSHKGCSHSIVKLYQTGFVTGTLALKFSLMIKDIESGLRFGHMRTCALSKNRNLKCGNKIKATMTSSCGEFKPFWISIAESGTVMVGEGCEVGRNTLWTMSDIGSFSLGEIGLSSLGTTLWKFDEECVEAETISHRPSIAPVSNLPVHETLETDKGKELLRLSQNGIDVTAISFLFFEVTSCVKGTIFFFPFGEKIGDRVHKVAIQVTNTDGNIVAKHKKCTIQENEHEELDCTGAVSHPIEPICNEFKTFWIRINPTGQTEIGVGCNPENGAMFTYYDERPFTLGDIALDSRGPATWRFGTSICSTASSPTSSITSDNDEDDVDDPDSEDENIADGTLSLMDDASVHTRTSGSVVEVEPDNMGTDGSTGSGQRGELSDTEAAGEEDQPNLSSILKSFLDGDGSSAGTTTPSLGMLLAVCLHHLWHRLFGQTDN
ncbi:uncharacterized protein [Haliotis asinina]|uniref:uncharacterized protein n=1 Tax=Haliotis asinina TaxID=109174 RepID=UPI0035327D7C